MSKALFVSLALVLCSTACADKAITAAGVTVKIKGQSGKMTLTVPTADANTTDVECQMVALRQLDATGNTLGGGGSEKHSFNSFATQEFTFSEPTTGQYEGLNVSRVTFESILVGSSKVFIDTMIFQQDGEFTVGNDTVRVGVGAVKFNVVLSSWSWCGGAVSCKSGSGDGDSVELDLSIESKDKGSPSSTSKGGAFDLGGGTELLMLSTYSVDDGNSWIEMPSGYPKVDGSKFTLKFPRWPENASVLYDPVVSSTSSTTEAPTAKQTEGQTTAEPIVEQTTAEPIVSQTTVEPVDNSIAAEGVTVKVKGQSGKMTLTIPTLDDSTMDVECQMVALRQLDVQGNTLGSGGSEKHSFNSFATQSFTFSDPTTAKYGGLDVSKIIFESTLVGSSKVLIETMIFLKDGTFNVGNDTVSVRAGAVKFNVVLSSWSWCGGAVTCKSKPGTGDSVELDLSIESKSKGSPKATSKGGAFDLGGGNELLMLNTYSVDGGSSWIEMPTGYPKVDGSKFTLKFPRWSDSASVVYDPVVTSVEPTTSPGSVFADTAEALGMHLMLAVAILGMAVV